MSRQGGLETGNLSERSGDPAGCGETCRSEEEAGKPETYNK